MKRFIFNQAIVLSIFSLIAFSALAQTTDWKIKKTAWTETDERAYVEFVSLIGQAVEKRECNSFQSCLNHPNNPYRGSDTAKLKIFADCAKLSYAMRGYFAWKNGLPFSFTSDVELRPVPGNTGDKRYSRYGNIVTQRMDLLPRKRPNGEIKFVDAIGALTKTIVNEVFSANFRINYTDIDATKLFADFYPVEISGDGIQPGTNLYDPNGHVAIVYKVTDDGRIYFIDAHPDNSLTSGLFGTKFVRSNPGQGAGFKNFRPYHLEGAQYDAKTGSYYGGVVVPSKDKDLPLHGIVQFFGTNMSIDDWKKSIFQIDGVTYSYYDFIRMKLSKGNLKLDPVIEIKSLADDLCQSVQDRVEAVDSALRTGMQNKSHPERLPVNIYGTSGEWEDYSTPSRDARLKTSFKELRDLAENLYNMYLNHDPRLVYNGTNIKQDMLSSYRSVVAGCQINYTKSNGQMKSLSLDEVRLRLFALSFDPYHCVELRWGESLASELSTCADGTNKRQWYQAEIYLRNQIERRYDVRMDLSLSELMQGPRPGIGEANPPDVDIVGYLNAGSFE